MALALKTALMDKNTQENLIKGAAVVLESAPIAILAGVLGIGVSWNLEHISLEKVIDYDYTTRSVPIYATDPLRYREVRSPIPGTARERWKLRRISTQDTSDLRNPNTTPLMPPIQSTAIRLADAGADTAEAALSLAAKQLENVQKKGAVQGFLEFLFGGGG